MVFGKNKKFFLYAKSKNIFVIKKALIQVDIVNSKYK